MPIDPHFYEHFKNSTVSSKRRKVKRVLLRKFRYRIVDDEMIENIVVEKYINPLFRIFEENGISSHEDLLENFELIRPIIEEMEQKFDEELENL